FGALAMSAGVLDDYAMYMFERAMHPEILQQIFVQGRRKPMFLEYVNEVRAIGGALEAVHMQTSSCPVFPSPSSHPLQQTSTFSSSSIPMEINCTSQSHQGPPCFPAPPCTPFSPPAACQAQVPEDPQLCQLQGMSFEEMQAFFYNKQVNEMRSQGKGFDQ
ncbi:hypothetical protein PISMIDRAFT_118964, partial [Pisolithus microcarpus 441]